MFIIYNKNTDLSFRDTILCYTILFLLKKLPVSKYLRNNHTHDAFNSYNYHITKLSIKYPG